MTNTAHEASHERYQVEAHRYARNSREWEAVVRRYSPELDYWFPLRDTLAWSSSRSSAIRQAKRHFRRMKDAPYIEEFR